jgi:hypothetical protein
MEASRLPRLYRLAGFCVLFFLFAQIFQALCYWLWLPDAQSLSQDLLQRTLVLDRVRSLLVMGGIVALLLPYVTIALARFPKASAASVLGVIFGTLFVAAELFHRSLDFFVISLRWATAYRISDLGRDLILQRFELWNQVVQGWYFPLLLTHLLASICFLVATWEKAGRGWWLAPAAFALNAARLLGRILSTFAGQAWLAAFNDLPVYFTLVAITNAMLAAWFFWSANRSGQIHDSPGLVFR